MARVKEFARVKDETVKTAEAPKVAPCGLSGAALMAVWAVFGPQSKILPMTPQDMPVVGEIQQWTLAQAKTLQPDPPKE